MGITGLIPFLEKASRPVQMRELANSTVAIDTYCWLHRGTVACAEKLFRGEKTDIHINYCLKLLQALIAYDVKPILVFDGRHLKAKRHVEEDRRKSRKDAKEKAKILMAEGKTAEARTYVQRAIDVTHEMALDLIRECRRRNIDCIVSPYEADGQLAYLNREGIAQYVITEDSDLVLFGCDKILFKFNFSGGLLVESEKLHLTMGCRQEKFIFDKFRSMCILSGCDYLKSLPGIGLAKAKKFWTLTEETDVKRALGKIPSYLNLKVVVTEEYKQGFLKAIATFKHMIVYDPRERRLTRLTEVGNDMSDESLLENAGEFFDSETAFQLALGNINPKTMKQLDYWNPDTASPPKSSSKTAKHCSIWGTRGKTFKVEEPDLDLSQVKRVRAAVYYDDDTDLNKTIKDDEQIFELYGSPPSKKLRTSISDRTPDKSLRNPFKTYSLQEQDLRFIERGAEITESTSLVQAVKVVTTPERSSQRNPSTPSPRSKTNKVVSHLFADLKPKKSVEEVAMERIRERLRLSKKEYETPQSMSQVSISSAESGESLSDSFVSRLEPTITIDEDDEPMTFSESKVEVKVKATIKTTTVRHASRPSGLSRKALIPKKNQPTLSAFGFTKPKN